MIETYSSNKRKMCVIFNQVDFDDQKSTVPLTPGTHEDGERMKELFTFMEFQDEDIDLKVDRNSLEFRSCLKEVKTKFESDDVGLLIVIIISHGNKEAIATKDGIIYVDQIISPFLCETLRGKPKIFLFETCRGENVAVAINAKRRALEQINESDVPIITEDRTSTAEADYQNSVSVDEVVVNVNEEIGENSKIENDNENNETSKTEPPPNKPVKPKREQINSPEDLTNLPVDANTLFLYATVSDYVCFYEKITGSHYLNYLDQVFREKFKKLDVIEMLTMVNSLVAKNVQFCEIITENNKRKLKRDKIFTQMPCFKSKLTKKLFLSSEEECPGAVIINNYKTEDEIQRQGENNNFPGYCLIFSKERYKNDEKNLEVLFKETIGFSNENVKIFRNKNRREISEIIKETTAKIVLKKKNIKLFVIAVLTHGDCDETLDNVDDIFSIDYFVEPIKECEKIIEMPKLFLIQADGLDLNKTRQNANEVKVDKTFFPIPPTGVHLPSESNMLFMYSNVVGKTQQNEGTPLVYHFCDSVEENLNNDLLSILTDVNRKLMNDVNNHAQNKMAFFESRLLTNVRFN